jgi:acetyl esterase/lipase
MFPPRILSLIAAMLGFGSMLIHATDPAKLVLAHYMPWYGTKQVSGKWGWHWTMDHFDPDRVLWKGDREAASHDYPLIGLYDSGDDQALECQVLLMKLAGLDGVIIDWYGTKPFNDYAVNHRNTMKLIPWLKKAGLHFAICYEDQAIGQMIQGKALTADEAVKQGTLDLQWAGEHWFNDEAYVKQDGRPVMLVFGPQYFKRGQWDAMRAAVASKPLIFALPHLAKEHGADGIYGWPPVEGGKTLSPAKWHQELDSLYARGKAGEPVIATVFPGFKDIYKQAGVHDSYGSIAPRDGATLTESLDLALKSNSRIIQIATWNDYGEGTMIEPTRNNGYRYLEKLQATQKAAKRLSVTDLRLPVMLYQLRKRSAGDAEITGDLDRAADLLFASKCLEAEALLAKAGIKLGQRHAVFADAPGETDENYRLITEVLYRDGRGITDAMQQRCRLDLYLPVRKPFTTVVWFHGGGLTAGERSIPMPLRNKGVAVVAVNYRLSPGAKSPAFLEDAAAAVAWAFKNISNYGGSPDRLFVSGHSAGAYLTAMIGLDKHWLAAHDIDANRIAGLIPLSPQVITHFAIREERGMDELQPIVDELAPLFHIRKDAPPLLIITGDREMELMGRYEENAYFWRMLKLTGHQDVTLHELGGFDHGKMPEPAFPLLLKFMQDRVANKK